MNYHTYYHMYIFQGLEKVAKLHFTSKIFCNFKQIVKYTVVFLKIQTDVVQDMIVSFTFPSRGHALFKPI